MTTRHGRGRWYRPRPAGPSILSHPWSPDVTTNPQTDDRNRVAANEASTATDRATAAGQNMTFAVSVPASAPTDRTAKAESLLLRFAAEAHRRKWDYDRGLDDDGVPRKSEAFDALHRLGEEMRTALEELRREPAAQPASGSGRVAAETQPLPAAELSAPERQFLTFALELAADEMASRGDEFGDDDEAALETLRRIADGEQQPDTEAPWATDGARIGRTLMWSWADIGKGEFARGYRAAQEQARAFLTCPLLGAPEAQQPAVVSQPDGEQRCPAKHGALGRICELPTGHDGMHTGSGPNGGAVWDGDAP